jgi:hypothetical protein
MVSLIHRLPDKSCALDVLPAPQSDLIAPFLSELYNRSLFTATVLAAFMSAQITPLPKKPDLNTAYTLAPTDQYQTYQ